MSSYLSFRKNGVDIGSYSRNSKIYEVFESQIPYGKWSKLDVDALSHGITVLQEEIREDKVTIEKYQRIIVNLKTYEDLWEAETSVEGLEEDIKECETTIATIQTYLNIYNKYAYEEDQEEKWEWKID